MTLNDSLVRWCAFSVAFLATAILVLDASAQQRRRGRPPQSGEASSRGQESSESQTEAKQEIKPALPQDWADQVTWRSIGPANMGGRITAITVYEADPSIWWAATASGGLLKTTNNGITLEHQFDDQSTVSIGDVQVAQSNPDIVWVGTGESNPRNSVSWGDGVYKSTDGGKTWKNMGLEKTFQTGAIAIHPEDPNTVWVGSLGRLWGANPERGLFKTTDGGENWKKVLYVDDKTGVVDVQIDPENPDNLLVATYERKRDGFDGNDPVQRFGAGSGIYKSTDGGESFKRISDGLPTCKMGRIGLDYFEADPNVVVAIVESEKIAKEPENYAYLGIRRGENADVGAKITSLVDDGPSAKAGMKENDIVVSVQDKIVVSYSEFLLEVHKYQAGEKIKIVVVRDGKLEDLTVELAKRPEGSREGRDFVGTLGGQSANRQDTQGPEGFEYGGIYLSEDGGDSWKRINSLNPRPMYYSNIQIDPVDRNNIYVCGTSLYKSSDGGKTFTGDGGTDGIHVDHHALWIDKRDPRHMILGNDGGIYVTWDRMTHWDHLNHVAIGQFYHVGVDATRDYNVYGGLQDNGSWGGPSRGKHGEGPINSDWFRVGGGDGFITLVDQNDPNLIYYESQNGGMGRSHLETGDRGFIRPRAPRGTRYRFNWKTPFMLSPHNSKIHLSAGNYVFRSFDRGNDTKAISPEITNTDKGSGSAITESPVEPGMIYVGTTDGAVWMTPDGGATWKPLFYQPEEKKDEKEEEEQESETEEGEEKEQQQDPESKSEEGKSEEADPEKSGSAEEQPEMSDDVVSGTWEGQLISEQIPPDRGSFSMVLKLDGTKITGEYQGRRGDDEISGGKFNAETGEVSFQIAGERFDREFTGKIKGNKMTGRMTVGGGQFEFDFEATRKGGQPKVEAGQWLRQRQTPPVHAASPLTAGSNLWLTSLVTWTADPVTGNWLGVIENENLPDGRIEFTIDVKMNDQNRLSGTVSSTQGDSEIVGGTYDADKKSISFEAENENIVMDIEATVDGNKMEGTVNIPAMSVEFEFSATKQVTEETEPEQPAEMPQAQKPDEPAGDKPAEEKPAGDKPAEDKPEAESKPATESKQDVETKPAADDPVTGRWTGTLNSQRGDSDLTVELKMKDNGSITGMFISQQGEREITRGSFNPESNALTLSVETDQFSFDLVGNVSGKTYAGEIDFSRGNFTMEFELTRQEGASGATSEESAGEQKQQDEQEKTDYQQPTGEGTLSSLMPGPRWVSSLEASRFAKDRCYITFDGHRSNDDGVYVFVTEDAGNTWKSLKSNLPDSAGSVRVLREDIENENLLLLGCEFSSWYSIDRGESWTRIKGNLPTVSVHEFAIHPSAGEVVAGTHGRSLWVADISVLRQTTKETMAKPVHLYEPKEAIVWRSKPGRGDSGTRRFVGENPDRGTTIAYSLGENARSVSLQVLDLQGDVVKTFEASGRSGLHMFDWDLSSDSSSAGGRGRSRGSVPTGEYLVLLKVDGQRYQEVVSVSDAPDE